MYICILVKLFICALASGDLLHPLADKTANEENDQQTKQYLRALSYMKLPGVIRLQAPDSLKVKLSGKVYMNNLPKSFDARDKWPKCPSLREIRDQGSCGSCWAVSTVGMLTDRICIHTNKRFHFSAEDLLTCSKYNGCEGGDLYTAVEYWIENGIVSGGNYGSNRGCRPYSVPSCTNHVKNCSAYKYTPACKQTCREGYNVSYKNDKVFGKRVYNVIGEKHMMAELYTNGPFAVSFKVYEDFANYSSGVYKHVDRIFDIKPDAHAVKLMGWGVEGGEKYWLVANSWGTQFGEKGYFKIRRGTNECGIELYGVAGIP